MKKVEYWIVLALVIVIVGALIFMFTRNTQKPESAPLEATTSKAPLTTEALITPEVTRAAETQAPSEAFIEVISPEKGKTMLEQGGYTLVDVRTQAEYEQGHIPGALLIPNETIEDTQPELLPDLNAPVIVYCRSGRRSAEAAQKLSDIGYTQIYDLGGIQSWPYQVVTEG